MFKEEIEKLEKKILAEELDLETKGVEIDSDHEQIDISQFKPLTIKELVKILGLTIKKDEVNKALTFLTQLSAFTEEDQINESFNAPSSTGKSFIPLEISQLFPPEDVIKLGGASPTAFYHEQGEYDKETNTITVDLARKIIIFLDQPSTQLLERLRSLLSHDDKEIRLKITDKNRGGGNRTKNVVIKGFPAVIFCTAGLNIDEQEATRFLLLSPEISQEKIREGILEKIKKGADNSGYIEDLEKKPERRLLRDRISAIKEEHITEIKIPNFKLVEKMFFGRVTIFKPRHQRDIGRVISLIKIIALLNLWFREHRSTTITANDDDINEAFRLWDAISESQELNLPPYVYSLYKDIIIPAYLKKNGGLESNTKVGLTRPEIMQEHYKKTGRFLPDWQLRQQIIPPLETAGLIIQDPDLKDKRKLLIYPTVPLTISPEQNNSESDGGVTEEADG